MTIDKKLYGSFGVAIAVTLMMGFVSVTNIGKLGDALTGVAKRSSRCLFLTGDVNNLSSNTLAQMRGVLLRAHMHDADLTRKYHDLALQDLDRVSKESGEFLDLSASPELKEKMKHNVGDKIEAVRQAEEIQFGLLSRGDLAGADTYWRETGAPVVNSFSSASDEISQGELTLISKQTQTAIDLVDPARTISLVMVALSIGVGAIVVWIVRNITRTLQGSVTELSDGADQTANAASQISSSSQSLAQGASEQAASLEETSASAEEINSMARKNTDSSKSTADLLAQSQEKVSQANHHLVDMVVSMNEINESSGKISKIIKVIDEIAFQTNILALNAAVEAARAGEAGMGFAVVADEVRSLAQRSAQAAKDTAILIEDSIAKSNEGKVKVDQVVSAIQAVTEDSAQVKLMVDDVSIGSQEQSKGIDQIGRAIAKMEQVTQTTAANAEESAAAAEELNAQSEALREIVGQLRAIVGGGQGVSFTRHVPRSSPVTALRKASLPKPTSFAAGAPKTSGFGGMAFRKRNVQDEDFPLEESFQPF